MNAADSKIRPEHLLRKAVVYVRQSSLIQVQIHQESTLRQYDLQARALSLGWKPTQIVVVDVDLGQSASQVGRLRAGFQRLLADLVSGEVGAVLSVEVSRLARQDSEGHRLVEVAALMGTLLIDEQQVYDPNLPDDRLMLGLKVLLSSNEIRLMNQRLRENKLRKAQRGELRLEAPIGLRQAGKSGLRLDPDEQVQGAVRLVFERFRLSGQLSAVVHYFHENGLQFPRRKGNWDGSLEWGPLSLQRVRYMLTNPLYAGAYVYARTALQAVVGPDQRIERKKRYLAPTDWGAVRWEAFGGYIEREEYERNQARLASNQSRASIAQRGRRRDGCALLSGIVLCGRCGKRMYVDYSGQDGQHVTYRCNTNSMRYAQPACQRVPGAAVDQLVAEHLLAALTPAQVELSLAVAEELERQQTELDRQWRRRLEGAQYAVRLAQRRYQQVDPDNRLVARNLEKEWESALGEVEQIETEYARFKQKTVLQLSLSQREQLFHLAQDLAQVWFAPTTTWAERKNLVELLVADVTLTRSKQGIRVQIRWHTNQVEEYPLPLPLLGSPPTPAPLLQRIRELCQTHTDGEIAQILNQEGLKTGAGNAFTTKIVGDTRRRNQIHKRPPLSAETK
jgi:DNA invertase Pin-like site-specific DNA recombinase